MSNLTDTQGHMALAARGDAGEWRIALEHFDRIDAQIQRGDMWIHFETLDGAEIHVRTESIDTYSRWTADALQRFQDRIKSEEVL